MNLKLSIALCISINCLIIFSRAEANEGLSNPTKIGGQNLISNNSHDHFVTRSEKKCSDVNDGPSLDEFLPDLFTNHQRQQGAILLHVLAAIYFFTLLAVVCNDYFLPSVECICEDLRIPKDVAAATFMATATTVPEFFTNVIGTFITKSDIGVGTIIGSLMFNTLGVAALASIAAVKPVQLDWWPITRDAVLYSSNILLLMAFAWDGRITLNETIAMVVLFVIYFIVLFQNKRVRPGIKWFFEEYLNCCKVDSYDVPSSFIEKNLQHMVITQQKGNLTACESKSRHKTFQGSFTKSSISNNPIFMIYASKSAQIDDNNEKKVRKSLWRLPTADRLKTIWWTYTWPIKFILTATIPNPKTYRRLYPLTFFMCIAWIGINAYMIVWMITVIGFTFSIPDAVMGLTFLAAGGCMPEGISSVLMIRKGEGGVGVSNSLGANSLAILMSLGIPWLIRNILNKDVPGSSAIELHSSGIEYTILLLLLATISLYVILTLAKYRLKKTVGICLLIVYSVLISFGIMLQMNVFFAADC